MKKLFLSIFISLVLIIFAVLFFLSIKGYETNRFNNIISKEIINKQKDFEINFEKIKIKVDLKKRNLFFSTKNPGVKYKNIDIPIKNIKIYVDFLSLFDSNIKISRTIVSFPEVEIEKVKKLAIYIKPSNIKNVLLNNIKNGKIKGSFDLTFNKQLIIEDFNFKSSVKGLDIYTKNQLLLKNTSFNFASDRELILVNSFISKFKDVPIKNGALKIIINDDYLINGSLSTKFQSSKEKLEEISSTFFESKLFNNQFKIDVDLIHEFSAVVSKKLKINDYEYNLNGLVEKLDISLNKNMRFNFSEEEISKLLFKKNQIKLSVNKKNNNILKLEGDFKFNNGKLESYKLENRFNSKKNNINLDLNISDEINIDLINYTKNNKKKANITANLILKNKELYLKKIKYIEDKSTIILNNLEIDKNKKLIKFSDVSVKTFKDNMIQNDFNIKFGKLIKIKGSNYDSTNLIEIINSRSKGEFLNNVNKNINITLGNILTKDTSKLKNFNLIGKLTKGKFTKLSSKSEFSENNYLDISLKQDPVTKIKVLEIFSDLPKPLLANYSFFKGLEDGKMSFISRIDKNQSASKLTIENFKVKNAPGFAKLLALADFGGMVDLMSGDGLSFEKLEIALTKNPNTLDIKEIFAVGPSISILMEGYVENKKNGVASLRGTMVPAKTLNKLISKIPVIGDILIPKDVGEGLFGVSFKIKGKKGSYKTTVNPIKTLTPRFITKALEKRKKTK